MAKFGEAVILGLFCSFVFFILSPVIVFIIYNACLGNYFAAAVGFAVQGFIFGMVKVYTP